MNTLADTWEHMGTHWYCKRVLNGTKNEQNHCITR